jgi:REP element-mobilizing transposase RayT
MRPKRPLPLGDAIVYHCTSHLAQGLPFLSATEKEYFTKRLWKLAAFSHLQIVDFSVMSNHYHVLTRPPLQPVQLTDAQLLAKLQAFYGPASPQALAFAQAARIGNTLHRQLRRKYLQRMGNVSVFNKELKEGFTRWYNHRHDRRGTLWAARFGSTVVEDRPSVVRTVAAYIDLNSVRAGLGDDPKDYRFCGYAAAVAGDERAREGLGSFLEPGPWRAQQAEYRLFLFGAAGWAGDSSKRVLDPRVMEKIRREGGELSLPQLLRHRIRYMTDGGLLGMGVFVEPMWRKHYQVYSPGRRSGARRMRGKAWGGLCTIRDLRKDVVTLSQK